MRRSLFFLFYFSTIILLINGQPSQPAGDIQCVSLPDIKSPTGSTLSTCQLFHVFHTNTGQQTLVTAANKYSLPTALSAGVKRLSQSFIRTKTDPYHPSGSQLFTDANLAGQLDDFLKSAGQDNYFLVYFSRLHLVLLHTLYNYLTKIYTTFNLTHINDALEYVQNESTQALNRKTLIINHLVNLIEAQANQSFRARFPALPQPIATHAGFTMLVHDYGADLNLLIEKQEEEILSDPDGQEAVRQMRGRYITIFGKYLKFSKNFTQTLNEQDPFAGSTFVTHAQRIEKIITSLSPTIDPNASPQEKATLLKTLKTINPPIFFYQDEVIRILKLVPKIAQTLPKKSQNVPWPAKVIQDAATHAPGVSKFGETTMDPKIPIAFFRNAAGQATTNQSEAVELYVTIPTLTNIHAQQLLPQPNWLNSLQGVLLMTRAILGDFTALLDPIFADHEIIDPCVKCIVSSAGVNAGIIADNAAYKKTCQDCQNYLTALRKALAQPEPEVPEVEEPPPDIPDTGSPT